MSMVKTELTGNTESSARVPLLEFATSGGAGADPGTEAGSGVDSENGAGSGADSGIGVCSG